MISNAPKDYNCPFCLLVQEDYENENLYSDITDIIYEDDFIISFIYSHQWPKNQGHALVIPKRHFENIYDIPDELYLKVSQLIKELAKCIKSAYGCDGVSTRQHNEPAPAGNQDVWHFHTHIFPRYADDNLYLKKCELMPKALRAKYAIKLKTELGDWKPSIDLR